MWKSIYPLDRAHILLVAEGVKPVAYSEMSDLEDFKDYLATELKIYFVEARGRRLYLPARKHGIHLPHRVYTICKDESTAKFVQTLGQKNFLTEYYNYEGKILGYPRCCRKEYIQPTFRNRFNPWIIKLFGRRPHRYQIESVKSLLEGRELPEEFLFKMPSQTPCSVDCRPSIKLLRKWRKILYAYDPEAAAAVRAFNEYNYVKEFQSIKLKLQSLKITPEMFRKGFIFPTQK